MGKYSMSKWNFYVPAKSGEIQVHDENIKDSNLETGEGWNVIDGTGKSCASILAELSTQVEIDKTSFVEVIMPDILNTYDVKVWAEKGGHHILTQRKNEDNSVRILIQPNS